MVVVALVISQPTYSSALWLYPHGKPHSGHLRYVRNSTRVVSALG
jgi:hypothetical protein